MVVAFSVVLLAACSGTSSPSQATGVSDSTEPPASVPAATTAVSPTPPSSATPVAVLPGEPWIVYEGPIEDGKGNRMVRPDGTGDHWASPDVAVAPGGSQLHPDWSPDGLRLAFSAEEGGGDKNLWTVDLFVAEVGRPDATKVLDCVLPCAEYNWPAWSPDGRTLAFTTFDLGDGFVDGSRLMALDVASGSTRVLCTTTGPEYFVAPRWSPDGHSLVVEIDRWSDITTASVLTGTAIAVLDLTAPSPAPRRLTDWTLWANYPDWRSSGDLIVFSTRPWDALADGPSNLYTIRPDGSRTTALTHFTKGQSRAVQPTWTPDGEQIQFTKVEGTGFGSPTMGVMNADGTDLRSATGGNWLFGTHPRLRPIP